MNKRNWKLTHARRHDLMLDLPCTLLPSRQTDFEVITHTLYIGALSPSPEYIADDKVSISSSSSSKDKSSGRRLFSFGGKKSSSTATTDHNHKNGLAQQGEPDSDVTSVIFGPTIATYKEDIRVVAPLLQKGQLSVFEIERRVPIYRLGVMKLEMTTNYVSRSFIAHD